MVDADSSINLNGHTSDAYEAPASPTTKKRGRKPRPDEPEKKSRLQANDKDIVNPDPETETNEQRDEVKRNIGQANLSYDHGVYVIRPTRNACSRQTWPWYCLNFQSLQEYQDWLEPRGDFFCAICRHPTLGAAGNWGGAYAVNGIIGSNRLTATSMLAKLKHLVTSRPIQTIDMSNVTDTNSFELAIGQVPFEAGGEFSSQRIAWVFGCIAWWLISQYGTVYDPNHDDNTDQEPLTSFRIAGNDERFVGDKDLPAGFPRPSRIQGMVAEDINRVWQFLVQLRKVTRPGRKLIAKVQQGTHMCFRPVYMHGKKYNPPSAKSAGCAAEAALVKDDPMDVVMPMRQRALHENTANTPHNVDESSPDMNRRDGEETEDSAEDIEYVTFTLAGDEEVQFFELAKNDILGDNGYTQELHKLLHELLAWPKGYVRITGVSVDNPESKNDTPVNTLEELRRFTENEHSVFQLHVTGSGQAADPKPASEQNYRTHWIFKLEDFTAKLSDDGSAEAQHLFGLIRINSSLSKDCVRRLMALFKPLRDQVNQQWARVEELTELCEKGANMDAGTALGFRAWAGRLSDEDQRRAIAYLSLVELGSPLMVQVVGELIELFKPKDGSWAELRGIKDVFRTVDLDAAYD